MDIKHVENGNYHSFLIEQTGNLLQHSRRNAAYAVNGILVEACWQTGKYIVEYEQSGSTKSEYVSKLLDRMSKDLTLTYGRGFSCSNLMYIRKV